MRTGLRTVLEESVSVFSLKLLRPRRRESTTKKKRWKFLRANVNDEEEEEEEEEEEDNRFDKTHRRFLPRVANERKIFTRVGGRTREKFERLPKMFSERDERLFRGDE